nr:cysteine desulfurase [Fulvivirga sp. M361]
MKSAFPIFEANPRLSYLDNAATTQRPRAVIEAVTRFDSFENANIHRGLYDLSSTATKRYEQIRTKVAHFLGTENSNTVAFTKGTTESINIVAQSYLSKKIMPGDNVITTIMEHHANFIPWQVLTQTHHAELRIVPIDPHGNLDMNKLRALIDSKTKLVAINHISNTLGTVNPIEDIIAMAHKKNIPVLIDAAQSISHCALSLDQMEYDFLAFSGHKMFAPFGVGILQVAEKHLGEVLPYNVGGGMIREVTNERTTFRDFPFNLEAGTANISGVIGLGAAIDYIGSLDKTDVSNHIRDLTDYCVATLNTVPEINVVGSPSGRSGIVSFTVTDIHPHDVASFLNQDQIAVRAGTHCTQPLLASLGLGATIRASFSIYNTRDDIDQLKASLIALIKFWS